MKLGVLRNNKKVEDAFERFFRVLVLGVVIIIGVGGWWLVLAPQIHRLRTSGLLVYDERVLLRDTKRQQLAQLQQLQAQYEALNTESLRSLDVILPQGFDEAAMIATMEQFAEAANVRLKNINVTTQDATEEGFTSGLPATVSSPLGTVRTATISLTIDIGSSDTDVYLALKKFLQALESFVPLMDLRDLSFTSRQSTFTLQLQTPYLATAIP